MLLFGVNGHFVYGHHAGYWAYPLDVWLLDKSISHAIYTLDLPLINPPCWYNRLTKVLLEHNKSHQFQRALAKIRTITRFLCVSSIITVLCTISIAIIPMYVPSSSNDASIISWCWYGITLTHILVEIIVCGMFIWALESDHNV